MTTMETFARQPGYEDAFGKLIVDSTTNELDIASHYPYSLERWRLLVDGTNASPYDARADMEVNVQRQGNCGWRGSRSIMLFDTSSINDSNNIDSASIDMKIEDLQTDGGTDDFVSIVTSNPSSNTSIEAKDFDDVGDSIDNPTEMHDTSERMDYSNVSIGDVITWNFNSTGLSNIDLTGISKFGARNGHDIKDNTPSFSCDGSRQQINYYTADSSDTKPTLTVNHTSPDSPGSVLESDGSGVLVSDGSGVLKTD